MVTEFLAELPHRFYEENCLHSAFICRIRDFVECLREVERFAPYIDNWAVNDGLDPKVFAKHHAALPYIENRRLDPWTLNKAIQKARESYRITEEQKEYLNSLKVKTGSKAEGRRQSGRFAQNTGSSGIQPFG